MMTESEPHGSPKNHWTRWYMWLAYGGGVLAVVVAMAAASSGDGGRLQRRQREVGKPPQHGDGEPPTHPERCRIERLAIRS